MASFLSSLMRKLTGGGGNGAVPAGEAETYKGFTIVPAPRASGGQFNIAGTISKQIGDELKEHQFIRADTHGSREEAARHSISKAKQIIDEQADGLFG